MSTKLIDACQGAAIAVGKAQIEDLESNKKVTDLQSKQRQDLIAEMNAALQIIKGATEKSEEAEAEQAKWQPYLDALWYVGLVASIVAGPVGWAFAAYMIATKPGIFGLPKDKTLMDEAVDGISGLLQQCGMSKQAADIAASVIMAVVVLVIVVLIVLIGSAVTLGGATPLLAAGAITMGVGMGLSSTHLGEKIADAVMDANNVPKDSPTRIYVKMVIGIVEQLPILIGGCMCGGAAAAAKTAAAGITKLICVLTVTVSFVQGATSILNAFSQCNTSYQMADATSNKGVGETKMLRAQNNEQSLSLILRMAADAQQNSAFEFSNILNGFDMVGRYGNEWVQDFLN